jgi:single-stranded-DNA-specific exonuclease
MSDLHFQGLQKRWRVIEPPGDTDLLALDGHPALVARLLRHRGIHTAEEAEEFLAADPPALLDTHLLPDINLATQRLEWARDEGETVAVFGDFDADGVTGTALMIKAFRRYGLSAVPYIPHRVEEGHGLNPEAVHHLHGQGARLIVTVDCGVTDVEPIALARSLGVDVVVTDHHAVTGPRPEAVAIINPRSPGSTYPFHHLTGVGMALKLAQALLEPRDPDGWSEGLLELAAIGTITDMAPLIDENRSIVQGGLAHLRRTSNVGLRALLHAAKVDPAHASAETVGFALGPRLNAAGRLEHAMAAYELLMTGDSSEARALAAELDLNNNRRRELTEQVFQACRRQVVAACGADTLTMLGSADFNPGVVGLVAGKLTEEFGVPSVVYALEDGTARGSCRSRPGFHWAEALVACEDLLLRHGGHAQAAGFTCTLDALPEVEERLRAIASERGSPVSTDGTVDAEVELVQLTGPTLPALRRMEPFGIGNPAPVFLTRAVQVDEVRTMGADGQHFRLRLRTGGAVWDAVAFRQAWQPGTKLADIVYTLSVDHWGGTARLRLMLLDYAPA